ncbi:DUF6090 family protein [Flammeovirgaceae bacterium SG7u.111]|nr:DUF6090 family protein [Flammeovirgaceae bacterium SG7u.132]WPO34833.1 DUF6090 family protein [Flammeovirgaceae bacterium SG7u.111]
MINLFRKYRRGMLGKGNISQYLLYAIGEIALVVIGILIALQINNWNEERKAKRLEIELVEEVSTGLKSDLADVELNLNTLERRIVNQSKLIDWLENDQPFHDSLSFYLKNMYSYSFFSVNEGPYETLKQYGMRRIKNDSLRNQIANLYDIVYPVYIDILGVYIEDANKLKSFSPRHFEEMTFSNKVMKPLNAEKLKADNEYTYYVKTLRNTNQSYLKYRTQQTKDEIEKTIRMIENQLAER